MADMNRLMERLYEKLHRRPAGIDRLDRLWEAAVLIPIVKTEAGPAVLFEVRAKTLKRQPGEICFPGGKYECADNSFERTAIRETCEELGLQAQDIEICGELDSLVTHMGPIIHPFVGLLHNHQEITFNPDEVEEVFTVPLEWFLNNEPLVCGMEMADRPLDDFPLELVPGRDKGWRYRKTYNVYFYKYNDYVIWGLTARMLFAFLKRCKPVLNEFA